MSSVLVSIRVDDTAEGINYMCNKVLSEDDLSFSMRRFIEYTLKATSDTFIQVQVKDRLNKFDFASAVADITEEPKPILHYNCKSYTITVSASIAKRNEEE